MQQEDAEEKMEAVKYQGKVLGEERYIREQIRSIIGGKDELVDRFVEGTFTHAARRKEEMAAVVEMLDKNGLDAWMSKGARTQLGKLAQQKL